MATIAAPVGQVPKKAARTWWKVHQWVGLKISLFMTFVLFTGTLAVVSAELDWLLEPSMRVAPSSVEGPSPGRTSPPARHASPASRRSPPSAPRLPPPLPPR